MKVFANFVQYVLTAVAGLLGIVMEPEAQSIVKAIADAFGDYFKQ